MRRFGPAVAILAFVLAAGPPTPSGATASSTGRRTSPTTGTTGGCSVSATRRDGQKFVAGEGTPENGVVDPNGKNHSVRGYVPCSADGYWVEGVDRNGKIRSQDAWGDVGGFWRDDD